MNNRIVCAAIKYNEIIVIGARHYDKWMISQLNQLKLDETLIINKGGQVQGFIDQRGNFLNRQEAWFIAEKENQIIRRCGGDESKGGTLYSENLY